MYDDIVKSEMISQKEFISLIENRKNSNTDFVMVDVREQEEYDMAHIDGVDFLMPSSDIVSSLTKIQSIKKPIVIYCRTDRRSKSVHEYLKEKGLKSCYVKGGITEYKGKIIR